MEIAAVKEQAFLRTLGIDVSSSTESELDDSSTSCEWASESEQLDTDSVDMAKEKTYCEAQSQRNVDDNSILTPGIQGQDIILEITVKDVSCSQTKLDINSNTEGFQHTTPQLNPDALKRKLSNL